MDNKYNFKLNLFGGIPIQIILLVLHYGKIIILPWWVVWFPSLLVAGFLGGGAIILLIIFLVMFISEWIS